MSEYGCCVKLRATPRPPPRLRLPPDTVYLCPVAAHEITLPELSQHVVCPVAGNLVVDVGGGPVPPHFTGSLVKFVTLVLTTALTAVAMRPFSPGLLTPAGRGPGQPSR